MTLDQFSMTCDGIMIQLMTYNIRGAKGMDNRRSVGRIAEVIRACGARIVCLQEVHRRLPYSRMVDQPAALARSLGMNVVFGRNLSIAIGGFGNVVLTDFEVARTQNHLLTSKGEQRGALEVGVLTPGGPLTVFCTHFGLDSEERAVQGRELAALVNAAAAPKLVCGDFNEECDAAGVRELIESAGLIDADESGQPTFDSARPTKRIDMILRDPSIAVTGVTVVETKASDHLPVVADVVLPGD